MPAALLAGGFAPLEHAAGVELFNRQVSPFTAFEQVENLSLPVRHLLQQLESNLTELRGGSDYTLRKNQDCRRPLALPRPVADHR